LRDFANLERHCTRNSIILIHDCYPLDRESARRQLERRYLAPDRAAEEVSARSFHQHDWNIAYQVWAWCEISIPARGSCPGTTTGCARNSWRWTIRASTKTCLES
jgi:hypothetical protein